MGGIYGGGGGQEEGNREDIGKSRTGGGRGNDGKWDPGEFLCKKYGVARSTF